MTHLKTLGFTLIELVIVIVLLGILTATALPRFLDLSVDAKRAANLQIVATLNASLVNYTLQAQLPLNAQSPIQPTTNALSTTYGIMRAVDAKVDSPNGSTGSLLFFAFKTKLVGAAILVPRDPITKQLLSEGADPTDAGTTQNEIGTGGGVDNNATINNLTKYSARICVRIFNVLLGMGAIRSAHVGGATPPDPSPNSPYDYLAYYTNFTLTTPSGTFGTRGSSSNYGSCLWIRTDSIDSNPVFYIYYDVYNSKFIALEADP